MRLAEVHISRYDTSVRQWKVPVEVAVTATVENPQQDPHGVTVGDEDDRR